MRHGCVSTTAKTLKSSSARTSATTRVAVDGASFEGPDPTSGELGPDGPTRNRGRGTSRGELSSNINHHKGRRCCTIIIVDGAEGLEGGASGGGAVENPRESPPFGRGGARKRGYVSSPSRPRPTPRPDPQPVRPERASPRTPAPRAGGATPGSLALPGIDLQLHAPPLAHGPARRHPPVALVRLAPLPRVG